jgi:hypothetical protein
VIAEHPEYAYVYEAKLSLMMKQKKWKEALDLIDKCLSMPRLQQTDKNLREARPIIEKEQQGINMPFKAEGEHYVVHTDDSQQYAQHILKHAETIYKAYTKVFKSNKLKVEGRFPIIIFARAADYHNYGGPQGSGGFFHPLLQKVVFVKSSNPSTFTTTLYHELFHQFLAGQKVSLPMWFTFDEENNQMVCNVNPTRINGIRQAVQRGQHAPLAEFLTMKRSQYYNRQTMSRNYCQGWSFVYFLWRAEDGKYTKYVKKYYEMMKDRKNSLKDMYEKVFAKDIAAIEQAWKQFVLAGCR